VVNAEDVGSNPSFTKKNLDGYDGPLDGRKTNENNWGKSRQKNIKKKQISFYCLTLDPVLKNYSSVFSYSIFCIK